MAASSSHAPVPAAAVGQIKAGLSIVSIHIIIRSISSLFAVNVHKAGRHGTEGYNKRISSIRRFLTEDTTKTLVTSYIFSWLDYCNRLLMGTPNSVIQPLQKIQNFAASLVLLAPRHHHSTPLL